MTKWLAVLLVKDERLQELENAEHVRVEQQVVAVLQLAPLVVRSTLQHGGQQRQLSETPSHVVAECHHELITITRELQKLF